MAYLLLSLTALFWAGNALVGRALHDDIGPITLAFFRWSLATLLVLPIAWRHLMRDREAILAGWRTLLFLSLLGISAFNTVLYHAAHTTTATNIALIQTAMPAAIVFLGWLLYRERLSANAGAGVLLSMAGAAIIVIRGDTNVLLGWQFVPGDLWMLGAVGVYALYSVLLRTRPAIHPLSFLTATFVAGSALLLPPYILEAMLVGAPAASGELAAGVVYVAVFPSILAYLFWNRGVEALGSARAGLFICLIPVFASALAYVALDEALHAFHFVGLTMIVSGFVLVAFSQRS